MEEKEYLTYEEAADYLDIGRSTLYTLAKDLGIQAKKFKRDKKRYLAIADVKRMKEIREKPWMAEPNDSKEVA